LKIDGIVFVLKETFQPQELEPEKFDDDQVVDENNILIDQVVWNKILFEFCHYLNTFALEGRFRGLG